MEEIERLEKNNTVKCLWLYVLKVISEKPVHAYQIRRQIEERFGFRCGTVSAYHVLYKLTKRGLVSKAKDGRKIVYSITGKGEETLKKAVDFYISRTRALADNG